MTVLRFSQPNVALLTKPQLAARLHRSTRWIDQQMREGMPSEPGDEVRFDEAAVRAWFAANESQQVAMEQRVLSLESKIDQLTRRLDALAVPGAAL